MAHFACRAGVADHLLLPSQVPLSRLFNFFKGAEAEFGSHAKLEGHAGDMQKLLERTGQGMFLRSTF
jgi:hypothetical protein